jgi:hypothetical protein
MRIKREVPSLPGMVKRSEAIIDLMYSELSNRAAEICGPTVTAMPASRNAAKPLPLTLDSDRRCSRRLLFT